jgi:hypothetical protein
VSNLVFGNEVRYQNAMSLENQYGKDNDIRRWLKQFQERGNVLRRKGAG